MLYKCFVFAGFLVCAPIRSWVYLEGIAKVLATNNRQREWHVYSNYYNYQVALVLSEVDQIFDVTCNLTTKFADIIYNLTIYIFFWCSAEQYIYNSYFYIAIQDNRIFMDHIRVTIDISKALNIIF